MPSKQISEDNRTGDEYKGRPSGLNQNFYSMPNAVDWGVSRIDTQKANKSLQNLPANDREILRSECESMHKLIKELNEQAMDMLYS